MGSIFLALARLNFVAAEILFSFLVPCVYTSNWVVCTFAKLIRIILSVLRCVDAVTCKFAYEADNLALGVLFSHYLLTKLTIIAISTIVA